MDTTSLRIFVDVMRRGSFAAVARDRNLDPSSISRAIRALEDELGIRLFQRTTRNLVPTDSASTYFDRIAPLVDEIEKANLVAADVNRLPTGPLRVTTSVSFGQRCIVPMLKDFMVAYPDLTIDLILGDSVLDLVKERIDVAIRLGLLDDSTLIAHQLAKTNYSVVATPQYLESALPLDQPSDLTSHECVLFSYSGYRSRWLFRKEGMEAFEVPVSGRLLASNAGAVLEGARTGIGPALVADWLSEQDIRQGTLVRLFPGYEATAVNFDTAVWFLYASRTYLPLKVRVFLDYFKLAFQSRPSMFR